MTIYDELMMKAKQSSEKAYAPYSNFKVGACVLGESGEMYCGCNFENASYGLSICAERNAIGTAVVNGEKKIKAIAIYSPNMQNCTPCGACRQVILEFQSDNDGVVVLTESDGKLIEHNIRELLPGGFTL
jgi:cytidine deaminase